MRGLVLAVDEPRNFSGKNERGEYSVWSRRVTLFGGASAPSIVCGERVAHPSEFVPLKVGQVVSSRILSAKMEGKQMVFRVQFE